MKKMNVKVELDGGLEARPTAMLVQLASTFDSAVYLTCADKKVNAKSIMGMMSLSLRVGDEITIVTEGTDEEAAAAAVADFISGAEK